MSSVGILSGSVIAPCPLTRLHSTPLNTDPRPGTAHSGTRSGLRGNRAGRCTRSFGWCHGNRPRSGTAVIGTCQSAAGRCSLRSLKQQKKRNRWRGGRGARPSDLLWDLCGGGLAASWRATHTAESVRVRVCVCLFVCVCVSVSVSV